ncbi:hypothetical protein [Brevibacillus agri]|uniref:hypothetical protein n=1 Tax=Brevibacillus agri TaxID=51101 RepID=UPI003D73F990
MALLYYVMETSGNNPVAVFALSIVVEALSVWVIVTTAMRFFTGVGLAFLEIVIGMRMITLVEEAYVGRVNGTIAPLLVGLMMLGSFVAGPLMQLTSLIYVFVIAGAVVLVAAWGSSRINWASGAERALEH